MSDPKGRLAGRVALVTGAAKGQGRSHCLRLAEDGADIIALDLCADVPDAPYEQGTRAQLDETAALVDKTGRRALAQSADIRDLDAVQAAVDAGVQEFGRIDIVVANAGINRPKPALEMTPAEWAMQIDINLTGTWHTIRAAAPALIAASGGAIVITSSVTAIKGVPNMAAYSASKAGQLGLMRALAVEFGPHNIRVNAVLPTTVDTDTVHTPEAYKMFRPDLEAPTREDVAPVYASLNVLPVPWIEAADVSNAIA